MDDSRALREPRRRGDRRVARRADDRLPVLLLLAHRAVLSGRVEAPTFAFDYLLYLGCLAFATLLGYIESRFHLLQQRWDAYLLASAVVYFALAYRFDNRFVLSLALSTLAGWFGVRLSSWDVLPATMRQAAVVYGALVAALGIASRRYGVKAHFLDAYLHVGATAAFLALTSGATERDGEWWLAALLAASSVAVAFGIRSRRFAFVVYGMVYGYVGISVQVLRRLHGDTASSPTSPCRVCSSSQGSA